ncbi:hypothetical protein DFR86_00840 [Acidianus sulfidivorans JP7]|uniref:Uncharacterized protein n=1 Tax=Acidianus sulfidivorans JP7 TaxID=619593 RepID=A0A2U9IJL1_9CREN|nr:hypothetical protein [Acidianus sulfidivorans]AWR96231.1 hypothetical protein DFR86_00840 [Acidianus sulfidivorans JP7]
MVNVAVQSPIVIFLPSEVTYDDGEHEILDSNFVLKEGNLRLYVPQSYVDKVAEKLKNTGFKETKLEFPKGEKYSLTIPFYNIWELHVRIYNDGFMDAHFEVSREYFGQLNYQTLPSIYEVFDFYKEVYPYLHVYNSAKKKWIVEVHNNYEFLLNPPSSLTPWKPLLVTTASTTAVTVIGFLLTKLEKGTKS